jgi:hypothetical protein
MLLMPVGRWDWAAGVCIEENYLCYFQPFGNCTITTVGKSRKSLDEAMFEIPPKSMVYNYYGSFWWRAQLLTYFWKPNEEAKAFIDNIRQKIGFPPPEEKVLGIHVRGGDACFDPNSPRKCWKFSDYMKEANEFRRLYGVTTIYLATDNEEVINSLDRYPEFKFIFIPADRSHYNDKVFIEDRLRAKKLDTKHEVLFSMADITLLSECDYFIGTLSSNFGRIAYELMMAKKNYYPPMVTLDIPYCFHWNLVDQREYAERKLQCCDWI